MDKNHAHWGPGSERTPGDNDFDYMGAA